MLGLKLFFPYTTIEPDHAAFQQLPITSQDYIRICALNFNASPLIVINARVERPDEDNSVPGVPYYSKRSTHAKGMVYPFTTHIRL